MEVELIRSPSLSKEEVARRLYECYRIILNFSSEENTAESGVATNRNPQSAAGDTHDRKAVSAEGLYHGS